MSDHPACQPISDTEFNVLRVTVEELDKKFLAKLHITLRVPFAREVNVSGPYRDSRSEAIKDGCELGKRYIVEGEAGAKSIAFKLKRKRWTMQERADADEKQLSEFVLPGFQGNQALLQPLQQRLQPIGEGWVRHSDDLLVHQQSQIFFAQSGDRAGKYLRRGGGAGWEEVEPPHTAQDHQTPVRLASASCIKHGAKLDRAVLLNDITRIARLACKIPLGFVDRPACACAIFQGHRNAEAAQWCAENAHKKLLPLLAEKIHLHSTAELEAILRRTLVELDAELLAGSLAYTGCSALIAVCLGDRLVAAGVGQVRMTVFPHGGNPMPLLDGGGSLDSEKELARIRAAGGAVQHGQVLRQADVDDDVQRILSARNVFDALTIEAEEMVEEKSVRSAFRRLALRVHPDKRGDAEGAEAGACKAAFSRLDAAREAAEAMLAEDAEASREVFRVLRGEVHTRAGAARLLGLEGEASAEEAAPAAKALQKKFSKLQQVCPDFDQAVATCEEAVETLRRPFTEEALPRYEALLADGVSTSRAMGLRDLRRPRPVVAMSPQTASWQIPAGAGARVALLCGATAAVADARLAATSAQHAQRPKATALRWCLDALEVGSAGGAGCSTGICIAVGQQREEATARAAKKPRVAPGSEAVVRVRHLLVGHQQLRQADPLARRAPAARSAQEAEEAALGALERLLRDASLFPKLCRELSDCQTAAQPGALSGDLGWVSRGQLEQCLEEVVFRLGPGDFSDLASGSRGVHVFQRLG